MNFINLEVFKKWLDDNMKVDYDFDACVEDLKKQLGATGCSSYELGSFETKSGRPEEIGFTVTEKESKEDSDIWEITIEF